MNINLEKIYKYGIKLNNSLHNNNINKSKDYFNHIKYYTQKGGNSSEVNNTLKTFEKILDTIENDKESYNLKLIKINLEEKIKELEESRKIIEKLKNELNEIKKDNLNELKNKNIELENEFKKSKIKADNLLLTKK